MPQLRAFIQVGSWLLLAGFNAEKIKRSSTTSIFLFNSSGENPSNPICRSTISMTPPLLYTKQKIGCFLVSCLTQIMDVMVRVTMIFFLAFCLWQCDCTRPSRIMVSLSSLKHHLVIFTFTLVYTFTVSLSIRTWICSESGRVKYLSNHVVKHTRFHYV